ncbi:MAG: multicopper oxidase domain-containing protein [Gemmatimonadota bacterium]
MLWPVMIALLAHAANPEPIRINDQRVAAGKLANGVLTVQLDARMGVWYPDGETGMRRHVAAFAERGKALQNPGPLVRVPAGSLVNITLRNSLDQPLWIYGLGAERGIKADSFVIAPNEERRVSFRAQQAGTYYYAGKTTPAPLFARGGPDSQLNGAIVVDEPGTRPDDRVFLISWWFDRDSSSVSGLTDGSAIVINGRSWPHTERIHANQYEMQHWRWISVTAAPHPMHLHGFYFTILGTGDGASFKSLPVDERRTAVTEILMPGTTFEMSWAPQKPGNWIFHCHFAGHMTSMDGLNKDRRHPDGPQVTDDTDHNEHLMAGLVLGIHVQPVGEQKASGATARTIRLLARSQPNVYGEYAGYGYVLGGSPQETDPQALGAPGPLLVLEQDQPIAINIINQSYESAAIHWHGIELESFPDGVPGFSGYGKTLLPAIPPRDSLTVRFTPPRAGTFMYHSHRNEMQQIGSGMYGGIVVLEPGRQYNPDTDRVLLFSDNGPTVHLFKGPFPHILLNGRTQPEPMQLRAGTTYRFRLINIRAEGLVIVAILDGEKPAEWRMVARDGADLPPAQAVSGPAKLMFASGQIYDVEFTPKKTGQLTLQFEEPAAAPSDAPNINVTLNVN